MSNRRQLSNPAAVARLDQIDAAQAESDRLQVILARLMTTVGHGHVVVVADNGRPDNPVVRRQRQWNRAELKTGCKHTLAPIACIGLLHQPGVLYCFACGLVVAKIEAMARPDTCDACGASSARMHRMVLPSSTFPVTIVGWICPACRDATDTSVAS